MDYRIDKENSYYIIQKPNYGTRKYDKIKRVQNLDGLERKLKKINPKKEKLIFSKKISFTDINDLSLRLKIPLDKIIIEGIN